MNSAPLYPGILHPTFPVFASMKATCKQIWAVAYLQTLDCQLPTEIDLDTLGLCESNGQANLGYRKSALPLPAFLSVHRTGWIIFMLFLPNALLFFKGESLKFCLLG